METSRILPHVETQHKINHNDHDQEMIRNCHKASSSTEEAMLLLKENEYSGSSSGGGGCGREKLMKHREEVSIGGKIVIPEKWGQEDFLKDWIDYTSFDALLANEQAGLARQAIVDEARRRRRIFN